jgi:hypothetical protein
MHCYYNHTEDAVGTCKACGRAVCEAHSVLVADRVACAGRCENRVRASSLMMWTLIPVVLLVFGVVYLLFGAITAGFKGVSEAVLPLAMGGLFCVIGFYLWRRRQHLV